ncbi:hypothetical protein GCM10007898_12480 [Dyella flagellata]|uniref:DUF1579 domain-containing protein n=1 Tax=Dyella flagellata TaxID=1867833 RepID=A0ABQ5XAP4_9GAMM|nr:hypothetical protein GCM10007898_12480 [Dyella flagellata]
MVAIIATGLPARASQDAPKPQQASDLSGVRDFDFFIGSWRTHSRRLKDRLVGSHDWEEFDGTIRSFSLMGGLANVDDTEFDTPEGIYRGVAPRAYDPKTGLWAIWWIDGRNPHGALDPPVKGRFVHGIGTFYASDTLRGKPIKVRFVWSRITPTTAHWEQAYSGDGGKTWETNWIQDVRRIK